MTKLAHLIFQEFRRSEDRVNLVGDPHANVPVLTNTLAVQYFNPAAFAKPATGSFGNLGRDALYGPGFGSVNFSLFNLKKQLSLRIAAIRFICKMLRESEWSPNG